MGVSEKVAYLKGLVEGLSFDEDDKVGKVVGAIIEALDEIACSIDDIEQVQDELVELVDIIDDDLGNVEEDLYDDEDDYDDLDDELYEVVCPTCEEIICIDEEMLDEGEMVCPNCGESLEFDLSCDCCDEGCDCGCDHE